MAGLCEGGNEPPGSLKARHLNAIDLARDRTRNLGHRRPALYQLANQVDFSVDEIADSEIIFGEMRPRIRHRLPCIHITVGENLGKKPTSLRKQPKNSTTRASRDLNIPQPTVWRVLKHRLHMKPYKLQLLQALHPGDHNKS
ncbi:hypothetical protein ANN_12616 [Periplaneta americana]|uniref:Uncharacterized protein n=1 Tax=Periplaneta americana TaxID=6978 RepID=A0ABQ8TH91_PERAM|nr:hypothetical protein ANN_12616 [Periplaneta americana]